jgi:hypothetical protein
VGAHEGRCRAVLQKVIVWTGSTPGCWWCKLARRLPRGHSTLTKQLQQVHCVSAVLEPLDQDLIPARSHAHGLHHTCRPTAEPQEAVCKRPSHT